MAQPVQIICVERCNEFEHADERDGELSALRQLEFPFDTVFTSRELVLRIRSYIDPGGERYNVTLHLPDDLSTCNTEFDMATIKDPGFLWRNERQRALAIFHVTLNGNATSDNTHPQVRKQASTKRSIDPGAVSQKYPSRNSKRGKTTKKSSGQQDEPAAADNDEESAALVDDKTSYIRFGSSDWYRETGRTEEDEQIPVDAIVVAEVDAVREEVAYLEVPTWSFNGGNIFRLAEHADFNLRDAFTWDDGFEAAWTTRGTLDRNLMLIANNEHTGTPAFPIPLPTGRSLVAPQALPTEPTRSHGDPPDFEDVDSEGPIDFVVNITDDSGLNKEETLGLGLNTQGALEWAETYGDFETEFLGPETTAGEIEGGGEGEKTIRKLLDEKLGKKWGLQVWVLPQVRDNFRMYRWDTRPTKIAGAWLNPQHLDEFGRKLYMEVQIVAKSRAKGRAKKTPPKRQSADETDEDDDGNAKPDTKPPGKSSKATESKASFAYKAGGSSGKSRKPASTTKTAPSTTSRRKTLLQAPEDDEGSAVEEQKRAVHQHRGRRSRRGNQTSVPLTGLRPDGRSFFGPGDETFDGGLSNTKKRKREKSGADLGTKRQKSKKSSDPTEQAIQGYEELEEERLEEGQ